MSEGLSERERGLRRAAEEAIFFAVSNDEGRHAALGRMMDLLEKYEVGNASAVEILHHFEERLKNSEKGRELYDE